MKAWVHPTLSTRMEPSTYTHPPKGMSRGESNSLLGEEGRVGSWREKGERMWERERERVSGLLPPWFDSFLYSAVGRSSSIQGYFIKRVDW